MRENCEKQKSKLWEKNGNFEEEKWKLNGEKGKNGEKREFKEKWEFNEEYIGILRKN